MTKITVSLETAKSLRDAGWKQDNADFDWVISSQSYGGESYGEEVLRARKISSGRPRKHSTLPTSAPTAEQILRELPQTMDGYRLTIYPIWDVGAWCVTYLAPDHTPHEALEIDYVDKSLANAAAEMWIYLKENNLLPN